MLRIALRIQGRVRGMSVFGKNPMLTWDDRFRWKCHPLQKPGKINTVATGSTRPTATRPTVHDRYLSTPPPYLGALPCAPYCSKYQNSIFAPHIHPAASSPSPTTSCSSVGGARGEAWGQAGGCAQGCGGVVWGWERGGGGMYSIAIKRSVWLTLAMHRDPGFSNSRNSSSD